MHSEETAKSALQVLAIAGLALLLSMVAHKGWVDISALADQHSGSRFWLELARYFLRNLAGGAGGAG